jgi:ribosomal-protein-alanine N-acetyltransferase
MTPEEMAKIHAAAMVMPRPWSPETFSGLSTSPGSFIVWKEAGFALGRAIEDEAELLTIAVSPDGQRRGLGAWCLGTFEHEAYERGARRAFLEVAATNAAARALYQGAGWEVDGHRPKYYRADPEPIDAILMSKALKSR